MPIQIVYTAVTGRRNHEVSASEMKVQTRPGIDKVERVKLAGRDAVSVGFSLSTNYVPDVGSLDVKGLMFISGERVDDVVKGTDKELDLADAAKARVVQAMLQDPLIVSINLARDLKLPPPIATPKVVVEPIGEGKAEPKPSKKADRQPKPAEGKAEPAEAR